jgi:hypothetical protein
MGHSNMLLAVAGLSDDDIKQRTRRIASGDWSDFPPAEAIAFAFAHKLTKEPASVSDADIARLVETFGQARTLDLIWLVAWGNYMTRVADAFQIPLETENVFARPAVSKLPQSPSRDKRP